MVASAGIEPTPQKPKFRVLPLYYEAKRIFEKWFKIKDSMGGTKGGAMLISSPTKLIANPWSLPVALSGLTYIGSF